MITKESKTTAVQDLTMKKEYKSGEPFLTPTDLFMCPGHPFTKDPRGGIFRQGKEYIVENFETLKNESRGKHISSPEEKIEFTYEPLAGVGDRTQFIVKP